MLIATKNEADCSQCPPEISAYMMVIEMIGIYGPNRPKQQGKKTKAGGVVIDEELKKKLRSRQIGRRKKGGQRWTEEEHREFESHGYHELNDYLETNNCVVHTGLHQLSYGKGENQAWMNQFQKSRMLMEIAHCFTLQEKNSDEETKGEELKIKSYNSLLNEELEVRQVRRSILPDLGRQAILVRGLSEVKIERHDQ